ncbi:MAG: hypothetical protein DWQ05_08355 [Calditrichaeota bacterium]|nr:MAG: hypothetical protein DWQ05_08355 [Calditrichota bacterium]
MRCEIVVNPGWQTNRPQGPGLRFAIQQATRVWTTVMQSNRPQGWDYGYANKQATRAWTTVAGHDERKFVACPLVGHFLNPDYFFVNK